MKKKRCFMLSSFSSRYGKKRVYSANKLDIQYSRLGDIWFLKRNSQQAQLDREFGLDDAHFDSSVLYSGSAEAPKRKKGGGMLIASFFLIAAAVVMYFLAQQIGRPDKVITPTDASAQPTVSSADSVSVGSISSLSLYISESIDTVSVSADSICDDDISVERLAVEVVATGGEVIFSGEAYGDSGSWEFEKPSKVCTVTVTAYASNGTTRSTDRYLYPQENIFIWPVTPRYMPLLHDYYHVNTGSNYIATYTHNNGEQREKHYVFGIKREHYGFDITTPPNTDVLAIGDGTVVTIATDTDSTNSTGYGKYIIVKHKDKIEGNTVYSLYAHLNKVTVKKGSTVKQGQSLGLSGNTGGSRIPHLHLEIRLGTNKKTYSVDPLEVLPSVSFENLETSLSTSDGFKESSVALYSAMLDGGWDYPIYALANCDITVDGVTILKGSELEIVKREGTSVTCYFDEEKVTLKTSQLTYTYNYPESQA